MTEQLGELAHISAVLGCLVKGVIQLGDRLALSFANVPYTVEHSLRREVVANNLTVIADIDHIERMKPILIININALGSVFKNIYHTCGNIIGCGGNCVKSHRCFFYFGMCFHILDKVKSELIKS